MATANQQLLLNAGHKPILEPFEMDCCECGEYIEEWTVYYDRSNFTTICPHCDTMVSHDGLALLGMALGR